MTKPIPRYDVWEALGTALALGMQALEEVRALQRLPGPRGVDGLGFDDMTEEIADDGRTIIRRYSRGDQVKEFRHTFPVVLDRGLYKEGIDYKQGDGVTWGGHFWIAKQDTAEKPDVGDTWRLAVKRGRDGKPGRDGERGLPIVKAAGAR